MKRFTAILVFLIVSSLHSIAQSAVTDDEDDAPKKSVASLRLPTRVGNYLVGANLLLANASFQKGFEASYNLSLNPKLGFFVLPNIALGLALNIGVEGNKGYQSVSYGASPFARVYFAHDNGDKPTRPLQFFVEGGVGVGGTNTRFEDANGITRATTNGVRLYLLPGVDYFINDHVAAELGLEYLFIGGRPNANVLGLNVGFQIFLGR